MRYFLYFSTSLIFFFLSHVLISYYTLGDQLYYRELYSAFSVTPINEILVTGLRQVSSMEPLSLFFLWIGAKLNIDKDVYISFWNALLLVGLVIFSKKYKMNLLFIFLLLTNFYVIVLLTGAERLKFAFIILIYAFVFNDNKRISNTLMFISPLAHLQSLIFIVGYLSHSASKYFLSILFNLRVKKKVIYLFFFVIFVFGFLLYFFHVQLYSKLNAYFEMRSILSLFNITVLLVVCLLITSQKFEFFLMLSVISIFVFILGGERVNMIAFFVSLCLLIVEKKADHPFFMLLMVYFSIKSIPFINNIVIYGNGFP